eukprot:GHRQ01020130.1.p4 GENE.GHRQ01020130.1~~GHRQ01020130.1.p4  ORF type:complete len:101 (+),score=34.61 GHRQ01020130.1:639-941(+)
MGNPIYGDVFGLAQDDGESDAEVDKGARWGELEEYEEEEDSSEEEEEEEEQREWAAHAVHAAISDSGGACAAHLACLVAWTGRRQSETAASGTRTGVVLC